MQIKDLEDMPDGCKSLLIYADSLHEYFIFLTPEASTVLDEYLQSRRERVEKLTPEKICKFYRNYNELILRIY